MMQLKQVQLLTIVGCVLAALALASATPTGRILGGAEADASATPYAASLRIDNAHVCGASIISSTKLLTAAHCLKRNGKAIQATRMSARVGSTNQYAGGRVVSIASAVAHPDYTDLQHNLAVLTLSAPLQLTTRIAPIELPGKDEALPATGSVLSVAGWGTTEEGTSSFKIRQVKLQLATAEVCQDAYAEHKPETSFCLAHALKQGTCNGDGGSAAVYGQQLVGVTSFVVGACGSRYPDVFVRVSGYHDWLQQQLRA
ncbi:spheroide [Drosophila busckii]|uniref:trypsin n=1 Tax=Drosophila busckii TaxID=30019 RepID=A0A0M4F9L9_DROBS|nr:trypsin-7 [Drosophila busckii]ALC48945.1 spheroide [Drosophila busckii]